jgi:hypothetical protein
LVPLSLAEDYTLLTELASTDEAGGLAKKRSVLLLWFFRNVLGLDDLDAYEYVCDGDKDKGIDGLYREPSSGDDDYETIVIHQSKYTTKVKEEGTSAVTGLLATATHFKDPENLKKLLAGDVEDKLRALIKKFDLQKKLDRGDYTNDKLRIRLVLVTTGTLSTDAAKLVGSTNTAERPGYAEVYDLRRLGPLAEAVAAPEVQSDPITAACPAKSVVITGKAPNRVAVAALKASDVVKWKGLESRSLFSLNVRRELRKNKVREQLDGAIRRPTEHGDFLSYHNGMTVVCDSFEAQHGKLTAKAPSIVNGAQSAIAFAAAANEGKLTDDLRIFVKFVEVKGRPQLAKEVSWRSNTQTAVNARNLMAIGGPQARIKKEVEKDYKEVIYEITPDASFKLPKGKKLLANDEAAQLLCAIFNAMPWLAVKRLSLFESDNHALIFNDRITGAHVVLADFIREQVDGLKAEFPEAYRASWRLTRLVAVYLTAQVLEADKDLRPILADPKAALSDRKALKTKIDFPVRVAATVLEQRHDHLRNNGLPDNFNVDFKNEEELQKLRDEARKTAIAYKKLGSPKATSTP